MRSVWKAIDIRQFQAVDPFLYCGDKKRELLTSMRDMRSRSFLTSKVNACVFFNIKRSCYWLPQLKFFKFLVHNGCKFILLRYPNRLVPLALKIRSDGEISSDKVAIMAGSNDLAESARAIMRRKAKIGSFCFTKLVGDEIHDRSAKKKRKAMLKSIVRRR